MKASMASGNSIDDIIELYKRDVDVTLLDECLKLSVEERLQRLQDFSAAIEELRSKTPAR
jgi:hypothetical protein